MTGQEIPATGCTILEAARAAGISKNTAKGRLRKAPEGVTQKGPDGLIYVSPAGVDWLIKSAQNHPNPPPAEPPVTERSEEPPVKPPITTEEPAEPEDTRTTTKEEEPRTSDTELLIELLQKTNKDQAQQLQEQAKRIDWLMGQIEGKDRTIAAVTKSLELANSQVEDLKYLQSHPQQRVLEAATSPTEPVEPAQEEERQTLWQVLKHWAQGR